MIKPSTRHFLVCITPFLIYAVLQTFSHTRSILQFFSGWSYLETAGKWPLDMEPLSVQEALRIDTAEQSLAEFHPCSQGERVPLAMKNIQNPVPHRTKTAIDLASRYAAYLGTLHSHSASSDALGSPGYAYRYARDVAGLDFFALTDHPEYWLLTDAKRYQVQKLVAQAAARPNFVPLFGFEYSSPAYGHYVVLDSGTVHMSLGDLSLSEFYRWLGRPEQKDALAIFAHPGFHEYRYGFEFNHLALGPKNIIPKLIAIEVFHWDEFQRYFRGFGGKKPFIDEANEQGWYLGAVASQDVHFANWGTRDQARIGLLLDKLGEDEVKEALKKRRFYATSNKDLQFAVDAQTASGWAPMGSRLAARDIFGPEVTVKARYYDHTCEKWPRRMEAVIGGQVVASYIFPDPKVPYGFPYAAEATLKIPLAEVPKRFNVYVRFFQGRGKDEAFTESSPIFFDLGGPS